VEKSPEHLGAFKSRNYTHFIETRPRRVSSPSAGTRRYSQRIGKKLFPVISIYGFTGFFNSFSHILCFFFRKDTNKIIDAGFFSILALQFDNGMSSFREAASFLAVTRVEF